MNMIAASLFDNHGSRIPSPDMRVFDREPDNRYYKLRQPELDFNAIHNRLAGQFGKVIDAYQFKDVCVELLDNVQYTSEIHKLLYGVHVPFFCPQQDHDMDLGTEMDKIFLPSVGRAFTKEFPSYHFKVMPPGLACAGKISVAENSRYDNFLAYRKRGFIVGWYFPEACVKFDLESQRRQMDALPMPDNLTLSGGFDVAASLIGSPSLLVNYTDYPPVLCLSGMQHEDPRLFYCFKAYGLGLEFWEMKQMLRPGVPDVSAQWSGGITVYWTFGKP